MCRGHRCARGIGRARSALLLAAATLSLMCGVAPRAGADTAGTVHFVRAADSAFDAFTSSPSPAAQAWLRAHMWRLIVWSPFFDQRTAWYPEGWMYRDAYAIYASSTLAAQHPEWILKDAAGNNLYIPWGCSSGTCPQYAGDISNPAFRHHWIEEVRAGLAHGYRGLFVDDVNMEERTGDGQEREVAPLVGGATLSAGSWRAFMAQFMAEVRAALPGIEIVHNAIWFANSGAGTSDPSIRREAESADYINLERGVNDSGLTGGSGRWSLSAFFAYIDSLHALGRGVVLEGGARDPRGMEYNLASYLLVSNGNDAVSGGGQTPSSWWPGWDVNLGEATDARHGFGGLLRRDFTGGIVLVNPPGAATQTVALPAAMRDVAGNLVQSVTLPAASGAVLRAAPPRRRPCWVKAPRQRPHRRPCRRGSSGLATARAGAATTATGPTTAPVGPRAARRAAAS
jgi:hypothetical protein